jgi:hypothetical protein
MPGILERELDKLFDCEIIQLEKKAYKGDKSLL